MKLRVLRCSFVGKGTGECVTGLRLGISIWWYGIISGRHGYSARKEVTLLPWLCSTTFLSWQNLQTRWMRTYICMRWACASFLTNARIQIYVENNKADCKKMDIVGKGILKKTTKNESNIVHVMIESLWPSFSSSSSKPFTLPQKHCINVQSLRYLIWLIQRTSNTGHQLPMIAPFLPWGCTRYRQHT